MHYAITTDTAADLPLETVLNLDIGIVRHQISWADEEDDAIPFNDTLAFYERMREGGIPSAKAPQPAQIAAFWEPYLLDGKDVLFLCASRKLSATFSSACEARRQILNHYPERRITIIDTLTCGIAQAALVHEAAQMRRSRKSFDETANWVVENRGNVKLLFIPVSTQWLSAAGLLANTGSKGFGLIRRVPLIGLQDELVILDRYADDRKAFRGAAEFIRSNTDTLKKQIIVIGHADQAAHAQALASVLKSKTDCAGCSIVPMGQVTGAYAGPDALSIMFFGTNQNLQTAE